MIDNRIKVSFANIMFLYPYMSRIIHFKLATISIVLFALSSGLLSAYGPPDSVAGGYRFCKHFLDLRTDGGRSSEGDMIFVGESVYDSLGRQIDRIEYESVGVARVRIIHEYGTCGCFRMLYYFGLRPASVENIFNEKCQKIQTNEYSTDSSLARRTFFTYDSNSKLIDQKEFSGDGSQICHYAYRYDSAGRVCEELWLEPDGKLYRKNTRSYNKFSKEVEYKSYYEGYYCDGRTVSNYNSRNELIEVINFDVSGNEYSRDHYRYDDRGNKIEIKSQLTDDGSITQFEQFEYDSHGNITILTVFNPDGQLKTKFTYIYSK